MVNLSTKFPLVMCDAQNDGRVKCRHVLKEVVNIQKQIVVLGRQQIVHVPGCRQKETGENK